MEQLLDVCWNSKQSAVITAKFGAEICAKVEEIYFFASRYEFEGGCSDMDQAADEVETLVSRKYPFLSQESLKKQKTCFYFANK